MLISSEFNRISAAGKAEIMRFSHYWLAAALSTNRVKISKPLNLLKAYGFFDYTRGYNVHGNRTAPSTIRNLVTEKYFATIDRFTFEYLLYEKLKNKQIRYRHIVVYALCKYIEQFHDGSIIVNDFGRMLGMTVKVVNYDRIKKPLEDLKAMKLINFEKAHGKITGIKVEALPLSHSKQFKLRSVVRKEAEDKRLADFGVKHKESAAAVSDLPVSESLDDIIGTIKEVFWKRYNKRAVLSSEQKKRIQRVTLTVREIHQCIEQFFIEKKSLIDKTDGNSIFSMFASYIEFKMLEKMQFAHRQV